MDEKRTEKLEGKLFGLVQVERFLGQGPTGERYLGHLNNQRVTVNYLGCEPSSRETTLREVSLLRFLAHPNLLKIYDVKVFNGRWLLVEEETSTNAHEFRSKYKQPDLSLIHKIAKDVALALHHLHTANCPNILVHLNLRPELVYISSEKGRWKLGGFSFCSLYSDSGSPSRLQSLARIPLSHSYWVAPEVTNQKFSPASDIYAFGILLWWLLTGEDPETKSCPPSWPIEARLELNDPQDPFNEESDNPNHPIILKPYKDLIRKCLQYYPNQRPTIDEVLKELDDIALDYKRQGKPDFYNVFIWEAVQRGLEKVNHYFQKNQDVNSPKHTGSFNKPQPNAGVRVPSEWGDYPVTLFHIAARQGHIDILERLYEWNKKKELPPGLSFVAAVHGRMNVLSWLKEIQYPLSVEVVEGGIFGGHPEVVEFGFRSTSIPGNFVVSSEYVLPYFPVVSDISDRRRLQSYVEQVIAHVTKADLERILHYCLCTGKAKIVRLITETTRLNLVQFLRPRIQEFKECPLMIQAVVANSFETVELLLTLNELQSELLSSDNDLNINPVHACALVPDQLFDIRILHKLINAGANINEVTTQGSPLFLAEKRNATKVCEELKKNSAVSVPGLLKPIPTNAFLSEILLFSSDWKRTTNKEPVSQINIEKLPATFSSPPDTDAIFEVEVSNFLEGLKEASTRGTPSNEMDTLFPVFLFSLEGIVDERHHNQLRTLFPEWDWNGVGRGFMPQVSIDMAISRLQQLLSTLRSPIGTAGETPTVYERLPSESENVFQVQLAQFLESLQNAKRKGALDSEMNLLFQQFLDSLNISPEILDRLQRNFPEWSWYGVGTGFSSAVSIEDAIQRVQKMLEKE
jgi:serine/threonine protein kinase